MTKYLRQRAKVERHMVDGLGQPLLDEYGQPKYSVATLVSCRKERYTQRSGGTQGQFVSFSNVYYFDESVKISEGDKIDGHEVQDVTEYVDGLGNVIGYEVSV